MNSALALAGWELRTAVRTRWVLGTAAVFTLTCLAATFFGLRALRGLGLAGASGVTDALVNLGVLLPPLLGMLLGAGAIAGGRERGMLALVASQPLRRTTILASTFAGLTATLWTTIAIGFGAAGLLVAAVVQPSDLPAMATMAVVTLGVGAASVSVGLAVSAASSSRMQATATAVSLWFAFAFGVDLLVAGIAPGVGLGPGGLLVAVLANPLETARMLALLAVSPDGSALGPFGAFLTDRLGVAGSLGLLGGMLLAWIAAPLAVAAVLLRRRDV